MRKVTQLLLSWLIVCTIVWTIVQLYIVEKHIQQFHDQQVEALKTIHQQINAIDEQVHQCTEVLLEESKNIN